MGPSFSGLVLVPAQKGVLGPLAKPMGQLVCKTWAPEHCLLDNATPPNKRVVLQELLFGGLWAPLRAVSTSFSITFGWGSYIYVELIDSYIVYLGTYVWICNGSKDC